MITVWHFMMMHNHFSYFGRVTVWAWCGTIITALIIWCDLSELQVIVSSSYISKEAGKLLVSSVFFWLGFLKARIVRSHKTPSFSYLTLGMVAYLHYASLFRLAVHRLHYNKCKLVRQRELLTAFLGTNWFSAILWFYNRNDEKIDKWKKEQI